MEVRLYFGRSEITAEVLTKKTGERQRVPLTYSAPRPTQSVARATEEDGGGSDAEDGDEEEEEEEDGLDPYIGE